MSVPKRGQLGTTTFVGASKKPPTIEAAIEDGYLLVPLARRKKGVSLRVVDIYAIGTNPITEYRVVLGLDP